MAANISETNCEDGVTPNNSQHQTKDQNRINLNNFDLNPFAETALGQCSDQHTGTLYLKFGPMFSGKTTWLNGELTEFADTGFSVLKITNIKDVRKDVAGNSDSGTTHNSAIETLSPKVHRIKASNLCDIDVNNYNVIGIDEAQLFQDLTQVVERWVEDFGKHVRVVGLDGDFRKCRWGDILSLIPLSNGAEKLNARCTICLRELERMNFRGNLLSISASFTKRLTDSTVQEDIGGSDKYMPVCRYHHSIPITQ